MIEPTLRKPLGVLGILAWIAIWLGIAASLPAPAHWLLQAFWYGSLGIVWIAPLKPALLWMETGRWRA